MSDKLFVYLVHSDVKLEVYDVYGVKWWYVTISSMDGTKMMGPLIIGMSCDSEDDVWLKAKDFILETERGENLNYANNIVNYVN